MSKSEREHPHLALTPTSIYNRRAVLPRTFRLGRYPGRMPLVTVAMPIRNAAETLEQAFRSVASQTHRNLEILLVLNGSDAATSDVAQALAKKDDRARILTRPAGNLASALNLAVREARGEFVARMDADDTCHPERLAKQVAVLASRQELVGVGSAFDVVDAATGKVLATRRPPTAPEAVRWHLLLENVLCHGSMMLRRDAILAAGGYDESRERAQDYELWLRLNGLTGGRLGAPVKACLACLPDVLYRYHVNARGSYSSSAAQAGTAGELLAEAWRALPRGMDTELSILLGEALGGGQGAAEAIRGIEESLEDGPSTSSLIGWLWSKWFFPPMASGAIESAKRSRLREVGAELRARGTKEVTLWGAGAHTGWLLEHVNDLGLTVRAIVDDVLSGQDRFGHRVAAPGSVRDNDVVLLSSDWHEETLWQKSATLRERGVKVVRLYGS